MKNINKFKLLDLKKNEGTIMIVAKEKQIMNLRQKQSIFINKIQINLYRRRT